MSEAVETGTPERVDAELFARVQAWRAQDPDAETAAELDALLASATAGSAEAVAELRSRFDERLEFGTAGLRGRIEAGPNRMNRVLVSQAAAGLAAYLLQKEREPSVVIGYDGRKNSQIFATDTAEIMAGAGVRAILLPRLLPTPVLAFAVRHLGTSAGVMVTASHNPPQDNGYKVYLGGEDHGSQIVPPADAEIARQILLAATDQNVLSMPRAEYAIAGEEVLDEYVRRTAALSSTTATATAAAAAPGTATPELRFVYTAMHGVGWETASRVFAAAGFGRPIVVAEQIDPDPTFHTVAFPNPEEPGALDLAFRTATDNGADVIIANDPDADRLAVAVPSADGGWRRLSGNEVGSLLGWRIAERLESTGDGVDATLAASIVSSPALKEIARRYRLDYADTLTGFKWVSRVPGLAYGYEEALGYLVDPEKVRDKDGISAAVEFLGLMTELAQSGTTFADHERAFAEKFGAYASSQISLRMTDLAEIPRIMNRIRQNPPASIGESRVDRIDDFADGFEEFPPGDILRIWLADGSRVILRPSGTEPKLKVYIDASSTDGTGSERRDSADRMVAKLDAAMRELLA